MYLKTAAICSLLIVANVSNARDLKVQVQMQDYEGESSYSVLYLVNPSGRYEQTLWVSGTEEQYYEEGLGRWWKYLSRKPQDLDGYTGATTPVGDRFLVKTKVDESVFDNGYKLRVETSVEDLANYSADVEVELTTENVDLKTVGTGWVQYIRFR